MTNPGTNASASVAPLAVTAEEATNLLFIEWSDGHTTRHPIEWLRWQCPCALCKGEMGLPGRLQSVTELSPEETRLDDVQPIGRYGLMPFWGDGHHDGIFTYQYLRDTCHCDECMKTRGVRTLER
jgi:DUF971 family protein